MRKKLEFIQRGGAVQRFHSVHTIKQNTVAAHSFGVAMLCYQLTGGAASRNLLMAALSHDLAEHAVGDVPAPTKRLLNIREEVNQLEEAHLLSVDLLFTLFGEDEAVLRLADALDGAMFCVSERILGNRNVADAFNNFMLYIAGYDKPSQYAYHINQVIMAVQKQWEEVNA